MADTAAALVIQLSADFKDFKKQMQSATGVFDTEGRKIAKTQADLKKQLSNWSFKVTGFSTLTKALAGLTAVGVVTGLGELVNKSLDAASAVGEIATRAGVSTDKLQELRFGISQTGGSFDLADDAITKFNQSFGQFVNNGTGRGAIAFKQLGIDKLIDSGQVRDTSQAFDAVIAKIQQLGSDTEKAGVLGQLFGKDIGPKLVEYVDQGADGIARLTKQAHDLGLVLDADTIRGAKDAKDKLSALFDIIKAEGVVAFARLAPEIGNVAQQLIDGLPALTDWVEHWADFFGLIKQSPVSKLRYELAQAQDDIASAKADFDPAKNFLYRLFGKDPVGDAKAKYAEIKKALDAAETDALTSPIAVTPKVSGVDDPRVNRYINDHPAALHRTDVAGDKEAAAAAQKLQALNQKRAEELAKTKLDADTAAAAMLAAQDQLSVQLLQGSGDYYAAVKKQIDDEHTARIGVIQDEEDKQIASLNKLGSSWAGYEQAKTNITNGASAERAQADAEYKGKLDEAGPSGLVRQALIDGKQQIQQYQDETGGLGLVAGAAAKYAYIQGQLNAAKEKGITLSAEDIAKLQAEGDAIAKAADGYAAANEKLNDAVQISDEIRSGLSDIGVAALDGFKSAEQAAGQFLKQLAQMILQLYVMKPLLESILGKSGSVIGGGNGSGGLGDIIGSLFSGSGSGASSAAGAAAFSGYRAAGGSVPRGTWAIAGEKGPEPVYSSASGAVVMPNSSLRIPSVPKAVQAAPPVVSVGFNVDARGAQVGVADQIDQKIRDVAPVIVQAAVGKARQEFSTNFDKSMRDRY